MTCRCNPPMEALPGDEWRCPDCGQLYWAADLEATGISPFEWQGIDQ